MKRKILLLFMLELINIPLANSQGLEFERDALLSEGDKNSIQIAIEFRKLVINAGYKYDKISVHIPMLITTELRFGVMNLRIFM